MKSIHVSGAVASNVSVVVVEKPVRACSGAPVRSSSTRTARRATVAARSAVSSRVRFAVTFAEVIPPSCHVGLAPAGAPAAFSPGGGGGAGLRERLLEIGEQVRGVLQ